MTRTFHPPKRLTPNDRLGQIPFAFRHTSEALGWSGLRVEHDPNHSASDYVHPPLECLWLVLTGKVISESADHRCDARRRRRTTGTGTGGHHPSQRDDRVRAAFHSRDVTPRKAC